MSIDSYIEGLALVDPSSVLSPFPDLEAAFSTSGADEAESFEAAADDHIPEDLQAAVNAGSLVSFVDGVDQQNREDILYSVLLAQRGASGRHDRFTQTQSWYQKYTEVLENVGWAVERKGVAH